MRRFDSARLVKNLAKNPMKITYFAPARIAALRRSRSPKPGLMSSNLIAPTGIIRFLSEEGIAKALNLSPTTIHNSRSLLQGICREAVELLKDKHVPRSTLATSKPEELVEDRKLGK